MQTETSPVFVMAVRAHALLAHLGEGDLLWTRRGGHGPIIPLIRLEVKPGTVGTSLGTLGQGSTGKHW